METNLSVFLADMLPFLLLLAVLACAAFIFYPSFSKESSRGGILQKSRSLLGSSTRRAERQQPKKMMKERGHRMQGEFGAKKFIKP